MRMLSSHRSLTVKLQKKTNDIVSAYEHVSTVQLELELLKSNCEEEFHIWLREIKTLADNFNIPVSTPRTTSRQVHRANIPADSPETYYRRNIMIPFLDHITTQLQTIFGPIHQIKIKLLGLIPSVATSVDSTEVVRDLYKRDLPSSALLSTEFRRWKTKLAPVPPNKRPNTFVEALKACDEDAFSNLYVLLVVACTLPVTTCETERCNSQLKLLKTYLRSTMTEQRLFALAMIKVHHRIVEELDFDKLVVDFANQHPRRMTLPCVFSDS